MPQPVSATRTISVSRQGRKELYGPFFRRVTQGGLDEVFQHALDEHDIRVNERNLRRKAELQPDLQLLLRLELKFLQDLLGELSHREGLAVRLQFVGVELGQHEQIPDQFAQALAVFGSHF